jgi:hypothetical protein
MIFKSKVLKIIKGKVVKNQKHSRDFGKHKKCVSCYKKNINNVMESFELCPETSQPI